MIRSTGTCRYLTYAAGVKGQSQRASGSAGRELPEIAHIKDFSTRVLHSACPYILLETRPPDPVSRHSAQAGSRVIPAPWPRKLLHGNIDLMIDLLPFAVENVETVPGCADEIPPIAPDIVWTRWSGKGLEEIKAQLSQSTDLRLLESCPFT